MSLEIRTHLAAADPVMGRLIAAVGEYGLVPDLECPPFRALARAIAHQQLNGAVANRILERFVTACGRDAFPTPRSVLEAPQETLRAAGFSGAKIAALRDLAAKALEGVVPSRAELAALSDAEIVARLTGVRGIGRWTVEMMLMFQLGREDVLPADDFGVRNGFRLAYGLRGLPVPRALARFGERWAPHRTAAAWYLWRAIDLSRTGRLPPPAARVRIAQVRRRRPNTPPPRARRVRKAAARRVRK